MPALALGLMGLLSSSLSSADEWSIEPGVNVGLIQSSNVDMVPVDARSAMALVVTPSLRFASKSESRDMSGLLTITENRYSGISNHDRTDGHARISTAWSSEIDRWGIDLDLIRDSSLNTSTLSTGLFTVRRQRTTAELNPYWQRALDPTTTVSTTYQLSSVRYGGGGGVIDYDNAAFSAGIQKSLSERLILKMSYSLTKYETVPVTTRSDTSSLGASVQYRFSERFNTTAQFGRQYIHTVQNTNQPVCAIDPTGVLCYINSGGATIYDSLLTITSEQFRQIGSPLKSMVLEPAGRNTAPALTMAALLACSEGSDPVLLVMPADHVVRDEQAFCKAIKTARAKLKYWATTTPICQLMVVFWKKRDFRGRKWCETHLLPQKPIEIMLLFC